MLQAARAVFQQSGYLEVETPVLSRDVVVDSWIEPLSLLHADQQWFLQTSPESAMKRLLAAGVGSIYQIARVFRSGEIGQRHNPEFTMLEWYGVGSTWREQLQFTETLVRRMVAAVSVDEASGREVVMLSEKAFRRTSYDEAFERSIGQRVLGKSVRQLLALADELGVALPDPTQPLERDEVLNVLLASCVEPQLGCRIPEFVYDYPASQAALAEVASDNPAVARRFELYINGLELCNGYQELTDAVELQERERRHNLMRQQTTGLTVPGARRLQQAMRHGLPASSGVALGFDRLVMVALGRESIRDVMPFPWDIA
jgi:lysyl-tRNA synthetase class 2